VEIFSNDQIKKQTSSRKIDNERKFNTDILNLKGISIGKVSLTANLDEESLEKIFTKPRELFIIQPFKIFPEENLYILPNNKYNFDLVLKQNFNQNQGFEEENENKLLDFNSNPNSESLYEENFFNKFSLNKQKNLLKFIEEKDKINYFWKSSNKTCGEIKNFGNFISLSKPCDTKIVAEDTRLDAFNSADNLVYVVEPTALELGFYQLSESDLKKITKEKFIKNKNGDIENDIDIDISVIEKLNFFENELMDIDRILTNTNSYSFTNDWKIVSKNFYLIKNFLMYERYPIYFESNDIKFNLQFNKFKGFIKELKCFNGNKICVIFTENANVKIEDNKIREINTNGENILESKVPFKSSHEIKEYSISKKINIYLPLKIKKFSQKKFFLPYLGYTHFTNTKNEIENVLLEQELHLLIEGGSLNYRYFSSDRNIIVTRNGIIYGRKIGIAKVFVRDVDIENNLDSIEIEVKEIKNVSYLQERQEISNKKPFFVLPIANPKYEKDIQIIFTNCTNLNLEPTFSFKNQDISNYRIEDLVYESNSKYAKIYNQIKNLKNNKFPEISKSTKSNFILSDKQKKDLFFAANKNLIKNMIKFFNDQEKQKENIEYLNYANFGVCKIFGFKNEKEGLIKLAFNTQIENYEGKVYKISSHLIAKVFIFLSLELSHPILYDSFTNELNIRSQISNNYDNNNKNMNQFILAPGSSIKINLKGGIEKWADYPDDYLENQINFDEKNNSTSPIDSHKNYISLKGENKEYLYTCNPIESDSSKKNYLEKDFSIEIILQNKLEKTLIKPKKSKISITIGCQEPKYLSLFFLGLGFSNYIFDMKLTEKINEGNLLNNTFLSNATLNLVNNKDITDVLLIPQKNQIEYFQQKDTFDGLRIYAFDNNKRMFFNFTSYYGNLKANPIKGNKFENQMKIYSANELENLLAEIKTNDIEDNLNLNKKNLMGLNYIDLERILRLERNNYNKEYNYFSLYFYKDLQKFQVDYSLNNKITQSALIDIIDIPTFLPNNSTLYLQENNFIYLDIINGSGDFEFNINNKELANFEYSLIDRKVKILPLKTGIFSISIKDKKIGIDHRTTAFVYISPIKKIELLGGGLLMVNDTAKVEMKVYNIYNQIFPYEQVEKMNIFLDTESFNIKGLLIKADDFDYFSSNENKAKLNFEENSFKNIDSSLLDENSLKFLNTEKRNIYVKKYLYIKGLYADLYSFSVIKKFKNENNLEINLDRYKENEEKLNNNFNNVNDNGLNILRSNHVKLEIFKSLDIFPSKLLMIPGSTYTLSIRGGPTNENLIAKSYEILDTKIAKVDKNEPRVKALIKGETILKITISIREEIEDDKNNLKENLRILTIKEIPVRVDFPDSIEIKGGFNRKIYTKSTIRLFTALKLGKKTFTYANGPITYNWKVDNIITANLKYYPKDSSDKNDKIINAISNTNINTQNEEGYTHNSIGSFLKTFKQGISEVSVNVEIHYPYPYNSKIDKFNSKNKIEIGDNLFVEISEFYEKDPNKSSLLLVPFNVEHEIITNKNRNELKHSLISQNIKSKDPLIHIRENGRISTFDRKGLAYVMIEKKENDNMPFLPILLPIYITEFYSIFVERSYRMIDAEVGQSFDLKVLLQHEYGILFAEKFEKFNLRIETSNPRIATVELIDCNSKVRITGNSKGQANIILLDPNTKKIHDVFNVNVYSSFNLPEKIYLNIGGEINFFGKDKEKKEILLRDGKWIIENPSILLIKASEGKAFGLKEGSSKIYLISKSTKKEKLSTEIIVGKLNDIEIDIKSLPKYFTDLKNDPNFREEYYINFRYFIEDNKELTRNKNDDLNGINQNIKLNCESKRPDIFLVETIKNEEDFESGEDICKIILRKIPLKP
jgi:hypothetical protein